MLTAGAVAAPAQDGDGTDGSGYADPGRALGASSPSCRLALDAAARARAGAEYFGGQWTDVGTPQRLAELDAQLTLATRLRSPGTPA